MKRLFAVVLLSLLFNVTSAQVLPPDEFAQSTIDSSRKAIRVILDKIRPTLRPYAQKLAVPETFSVGAYGNYYSYFDPSTQKIHMPFGLWHGFRLISWAMQDINDDTALIPHFRGYIRFVTLNMQTMKANNEFVLLPDFRRWARLPPRKVGTVEQEADRASREIAALVESMAFILSHELAHLTSSHKASADITPAESMDQEMRADVRALITIKDAGFDIVPAAMAMIIFAGTKISADGKLIQVKTHPHPLCRVYRIFSVPFAKMRGDSEFEVAVKRAGFDGSDAFIAEILSMRDACN